jgi:DNA-binding NarL/FixJ family response regulator
MKPCVRVLIADDQVHSRQGLQALLSVWPEVEVMGMEANGPEVVLQMEKWQPDVALLDIPMSVAAVSGAEAMEGLETIRVIKGRWPQVRIVVLTMYTTHRAAALAAGADTFLLKGCTAEVLRDALLTPGRARTEKVFPAVVPVGELG